MTLRTRLLAAMLALLAAISVIVGVVSVLSLDSFLVGRLDSQLAAAGGRIQNGGGDDRPNPGGGNGPSGLFVPGQTDGTLGARIVAGAVTSAGILDTARSTDGPTALSAPQEAVLLALPVDGRRTPGIWAARSGATGCGRRSVRTATRSSPGCRCPACGTR